MKTAVVAFGFGAPETILSNKRIAFIASQKARELNAPVYTQLDVRVLPRVKVEYIEEKPGNPPANLATCTRGRPVGETARIQQTLYRRCQAASMARSPRRQASDS